MTNTAPQVDRRVVSLPAAPISEDPEERRVPTPEELRMNEDDILSGLDAVAQVDVKTIVVYRGEKRALTFRVQSQGQDVYDNCRDASMKKQKAPQYGGVKLGTDVDRAQFNSMLIFYATVEEDRKRIWENRQAWNKYRVICGWDLIRKVLRAGEMDKAVNCIDDLSGLGDEAEGERMELAGNSSGPDGERTS